ncbi:MAG TPA: protein kinase [Kofleriaceae bacterium]|nr:protein kinase [Kofleriaceae bacterium]
MQGKARDRAGLVGRQLGEFVVREPLGEGGFGAVFRAEQPALGREAVIKVLHQKFAGSETVVQRFLREARLASRLDHPYAAHTYAFGVEPDGVLWIAMELVRGTPLDRMLEVQGPLPLDRFVPLLERICEVVHSAHEQGIVHRDLKPANVMVLSRAGRLLPKLLDLGIAKMADGAGELATTTTPETTAAPLIAGSDSFELDATMNITGDRAPQEARPPSMPEEELAKTQLPPADQRKPSAGMTTQAKAASSQERPKPRLVASGVGTHPGHSDARLTQHGATMGSPIYMAPEQWNDAAAVDGRTDLYALGVLCFEALTGKPPYTGRTAFEIAAAHAKSPIPTLGPGFPPELDGVLTRVLAKRPADRFATALELASAFRLASGLAADAVTLPRLDEEVRQAAILRLPRPLAAAVDALDGARNAHQARDALWQLVRVSARLVALVSLAAHTHVRQGGSSTDPAVGEALRGLRVRAQSDTGWAELARSLSLPFRGLRDAYPLPELIDLLHGGGNALDELIALRVGEEPGAGELEVRSLLERALPLVARLLGELAFLTHYPLLVPEEGGTAEDWTGAARQARPRRPLARRDLPPGQPVLADASGSPVLSLHPLVQVHAPAPGAAPAMFFLEGKGRRGARLVALPGVFEHEDEGLWEFLGGVVGDTSREAGTTSVEERCPFPGLAAFTAEEADSFTGRERETEAFLNRMTSSPLLAVVGPSGAGKSSFVRAGVLPGLAAGTVVAVVRPGPSPLATLSAKLEAMGIAAAGLREHAGALGSALRAHAAAREVQVVLVVDQLEELFTLCDDDAERQRYAEALVGAARSTDDAVRVVVTLRDDFLLRAEALPPFRARLGQALQLLTTPAPADLKRILTEPVRRAGYEWDDPALPDEMVETVADRPGALALLSFTAAKLWELRDRRFRQLGHKAYRSLGGVGGALAQHAEATLEGMQADEQRLVREVFRHLVTAEGTRAVLSRAELDEVLGDAAHGGAVVEKLVAARLLVVSEGAGGAERIEVTHEALLDAWPRLVTWRREDAEGARLRDQVRAAVRQWDERGRPSGLLWRGDALAEYRMWRARYPGTLTAAEEAFAAASLAEAARGRRVRRVLLIGIVAGLAVVAVALLIQNARVARQRARAMENGKKAEDSASKLHDLVLDQYRSQARRLLLADDPLQALAYLDRATELGDRGLAHDFLQTAAVRESGGELFVLHHETIVGRVRFSPDGALLATTCYDHRARVWDAASGALVATLEHGGPVIRLDWSPDSARVVTASEDGTAAVWDARSGKRALELRGAVAPQAVAFTRDGAQIVIVGTDEAVAVWDATNGARVAELRGPGREPQVAVGQVLGLSRDGHRIAVGDDAGVVRVWSAAGAAWRLEATLPGHTASVTSVQFSVDGARLVSTSSDATAALWDVAARRKVAILRHAARVNTAAFSPDGEVVVTGSDDRTAVIWLAATGDRLAALSGHTATITQLAFSPDGRVLAIASDDGSATLWDPSRGLRLGRRVGHRGAVKDVAFSPRGDRLATASVDGNAIVSSAEPSQPSVALTGHAASVYQGQFSAGGGHVVTASYDKTARVWDAATGREILVLAHQASVQSAAFSPDDSQIATGTVDGSIKIWDVRSGVARAELRDGASTERVDSLVWSRDGRRLLSAGGASARVWSMPAGTLERRIDHADAQVIAASFAGDGRILSNSTDQLWLWDLATGQEVRRFDDPAGRWRVQLDPGGSRVLSTTRNSEGKIWRLADGVVTAELMGHVSPVPAGAWRADGKLVATGSYDGTARVWDPATGDLLLVLDHAGERVMSVAFSPDGKQLLTTTSVGAVTLWDLPLTPPAPDAMQRIVRCRVPYVVEENRVRQRQRDLSACAPAPASR